MLIIGVDTGAAGAFAALNDGELIGVWDMPVDKVLVGKTHRSRVSPHRVIEIVGQWWDKDPLAFIERPMARPMMASDKQTGQTTRGRTPGAAGMLAMGESYGVVLGILAAYRFALTEMRPGIWTKAVGAGSSKDDHRRRACYLFPKHSASFSRVKDDGRADAALIAYYGWQQLKSAI